jgi:VIT1/CCC1 family predicted Fe2+/Mn2+ transporter
MSPEDRAALVEAQTHELTESIIYSRLARALKDPHNSEILEQIAADERRHHDLLARHTSATVKPIRRLVWWYVILARVLGVTFALKLLERGEASAQVSYAGLSHIEGIDGIIHDEEQHERDLIDMLRDERLEYAGSVVLGLNDALVELTGALAGLTLALANARVVAVAGLITGIAAAMSMAASEYLASKSEVNESSTKRPIKAALYTGGAYIVAVTLLILPFFLAPGLLVALGCTLVIAVLIIAVFNAYLCVARDLSFWPRFAEMSLISLGVAAVSFGIGWLVRGFFGLEV